MDGIIATMAPGPLGHLGQPALGAVDQLDLDTGTDAVGQYLPINDRRIDERHLGLAAVQSRVSRLNLNRHGRCVGNRCPDVKGAQIAGDRQRRHAGRGGRHIEYPASALARITYRVISRHHDRAGVGGEIGDEGLAVAPRADVGAVKLSFAPGIERVADFGQFDLDGGGGQTGIGQGVGANLERRLAALGQNIDHIVAGMSLGPFGDLSQTALSAVDQVDFDPGRGAISQSLPIGHRGIDERDLLLPASLRRIGGLDLSRCRDTCCWVGGQDVIGQSHDQRIRPRWRGNEWIGMV